IKMITWKWKGDIYSIEAFEIGITGVGNKPTPNSILKSEFVIINNENDVAEILDDGTMVFKCNGYNICEEYDVWIRPLFY
ncbi:MAG: hypothetical protein N2482_03730, partial [Patescibacteria group bacterium]|nr:hypothetical protein [Patescibacteria group bacterium]